MIETKDLILDKGKVDEWKSMYENVWRHEETARYMMWSAKQTEQEGFEMTQGFIEFQKVNPTVYFVYEKKSRNERNQQRCFRGFWHCCRPILYRKRLRKADSLRTA